MGMGLRPVACGAAMPLATACHANHRRIRRGAYHFSTAVLPLLLETLNQKPEHPPTLIFTSATAAMKGSAQCAAFATGKFAMRALAQSLAREFGPKGVHVNHAIIDGVIDIERTKHYHFEHEDAKIKPEAVGFPSSLHSGDVVG